MEILNFDQFRTKLLLEAAGDDPAAMAAGAPPPPPSPATDVPPPPPPPSPAPDLGTAPSTLPPDQNAPPPGSEEPTDLKFIFIQDAAQKKWHGTHDKDGGIKRFTVYSVTPEELEEWLTTHKDDENTEMVVAALNGKRPMPSSIYSDFKREVMNGTLGSDKGLMDISFDSETDFDNPSTEDLSVVFLKSGK